MKSKFSIHLFSLNHENWYPRIKVVLQYMESPFLPVSYYTFSKKNKDYHPLHNAFAFKMYVSLCSKGNENLLSISNKETPVNPLNTKCQNKGNQGVTIGNQ